MSRDQRTLAREIGQLLADPAHADNPLRPALAQLWQAHEAQQMRLERVTHLSDAYQMLARDRENALGERFTKHMRRLEKLARISDRYQQMMQDMNLALNEASHRDVLTGLGNRRLLIERLKQETVRAARTGQPYSLAMLDVDNFKQVNDTYGHEMGDQVLIEIGTAVQMELRESDLGGRWGGEEFLLILPATSGPAAMQVAERVRTSIHNLVVRSGTQAVPVSASIGVSTHSAGEDFSHTVSRADAALLEAKRSGRDRVVYADDDTQGA
ncbi:biofilm regulation diguanylate cyclase SiaD [Pigmentiphaga soli]|uniref:diguanylate cyclase n=1 Tax=Pigmentiphaga soli TaxID=1007095 RepID=A0ABP8GQH3_9BURK